jgi:hypothetical protein
VGAQCGSSARWDLCGGRPQPETAKGRPYRDPSALVTVDASRSTRGNIHGEARGGGRAQVLNRVAPCLDGGSGLEGVGRIGARDEDLPGREEGDAVTHLESSRILRHEPRGAVGLGLEEEARRVRVLGGFDVRDEGIRDGQRGRQDAGGRIQERLELSAGGSGGGPGTASQALLALYAWFSEQLALVRHWTQASELSQKGLEGSCSAQFAFVRQTRHSPRPLLAEVSQ